MTKQPSFQFYPGDWMKDPDLGICSIFARGLLVDLLCSMFEAKHRGRLIRSDGVTPLTNRQIISLVRGGDEQEKLVALEELEAFGVLKRDQQGALCSARMLRDEEIRVLRRAGGSIGGSKTQANRKQSEQQSEQQKQSPSSSSSSSSSDDTYRFEVGHTDSNPLKVPATVGTPFSTVGKTKQWLMPKQLYDSIKAAYPDINISAEFKKAKAWLAANPAKRKTANGMPKFLHGWIGRSQNNGNGKSPNGKPPFKETSRTMEEIIADDERRAKEQEQQA